MYSSGTGKELSKLGYRLDCAEYDTVTNNKKRFWALINKIENICQINIKKLHKQTKRMRLHNRQTLIRRQFQSVKQTQDFIYKWLDT